MSDTEYTKGYRAGLAWEQKRIIKLWEQEMSCDCENSMSHLIELVKGENN